MAIKIRFDKANNPETPSFILATKNGKRFGQIPAHNINMIDSQDTPEVTFDVYKYENGELNPIWQELKDFRLIWCKEWDLWFEFTTEIQETANTKMTISARQLAQKELSDTILYTVEINTEDDIARDDYSPTVFYDPEHPKASLLNRILSKTPHYSVKHVDEHLYNVQRMFSFDGTSVYDALSQISEEMNVRIIYNSYTNDDGTIERSISAYDNATHCGNDECSYYLENGVRYRGKFDDECPMCHSKNIIQGYGLDTTIFITADGLGNEIDFSSDTDTAKNSFKLETGDDMMTAAVVNCNPNGTPYIWYFPESDKQDMSQELQDKITAYKSEYQDYKTDRAIEIDTDLLNSFNQIVDKYKEYNPELENITTPIRGFSSLMTAYYDSIDLQTYIETELMPSITIQDTTAAEQAALLTTEALSPVQVENVSQLSEYAADNAVLGMARVIVDPRYDVQIKESSMNGNTWTGIFTVSNYSGEGDEDTADSSAVSVVIDDSDYKLFLEQKIEKLLARDDGKEYSIVGLFEETNEEFKEDIKIFCINSLQSMRGAAEACLSMLQELGISEFSNDYHEDVYQDYYQKLGLIDAELLVKQNEINTVVGTYETVDNVRTLKKDGVQTLIVKVRNEIQKRLNLENYLGENLWKEFCQFRREDVYENSNYISDGLNNVDLFKNAKEFFDEAEQAIYEGAELQHTINASMKNLLVMDEFKPLVDYFQVGNWIRVRVDDKIYKLQLVQYEINFDGLSEINVTFSDIAKYQGQIQTQQRLIQRINDIANSYDGVVRNADKGASSSNVVDDWVNNGINVFGDYTDTSTISEGLITGSEDGITQTRPAENSKTSPVITTGGMNGTNQKWDENGMLFRAYDELTKVFSPEQLKIVNNKIVFTDDNWATTKTVVGKFQYKDPVSGETKTAYGINGEVLQGNIIIGNSLNLVTGDQHMSFGENGLTVTNGTNTVAINPNADSVFTITDEDDTPVIYFDENGNAVFIGTITSDKAHIGNNIDYIDFDGSTLRVNAGSIYLGTNKVNVETQMNTINKTANQALKVVITEYSITDGIDIPPSASATWTTDPPVRQEGEYIWQRTKSIDGYGNTTYGEATCLQGNNGRDGQDGQDGQDGENALSVVIDSSAGIVFKNHYINTVLTCHVYSGTKEITNEVSSFLWQKRNADGTIDSSWSRTGAGNTITITNADVTNKAIFYCTVTI